MTQMHAIVSKKEVTAGNRIQINIRVYPLTCLIWVLWQLVRVVALGGNITNWKLQIYKGVTIHRSLHTQVALVWSGQWLVTFLGMQFYWQLLFH